MNATGKPPPREFVSGDLVWRVRETPGLGIPLVLLHGFAGDSQAWEPLYASLAPRALKAVDLPGHGGTGTPLTPWTLAETADALAAWLPASFDLAGYSLGGRLALTLALHHPSRVRRLALVSASAGLAGESARQARRDADAGWARRLETAGLEDFYAAWDAQALFATRVAPTHQREQQSARGLAWAVQAFSPGRQPDLSARLAELKVPTLWVAGAMDARYAAFARECAGQMPTSQAECLPDTGHDVLTERPAALGGLLAHFFSRSTERTLEEVFP